MSVAHGSDIAHCFDFPKPSKLRDVDYVPLDDRSSELNDVSLDHLVLDE